MKKDDYGFYGKGLDGYVHYRQGMEEAERSAPQSDSFEDSYDDADDDSAFEPVHYAPVSNAKPVTPPTAAEPQPAQTSAPEEKPVQTPAKPAPADGVRKPKWREHGWDIGLAASALLFLFFTMVSDTCQTLAADYAAAAAAGVFLAFVTVEIIRLALWIMRHM